MNLIQLGQIYYKIRNKEKVSNNHQLAFGSTFLSMGRGLSALNKRAAL